MMLCCYRSPLKANAHKVLRAFAAGWPGAEVVRVGAAGWAAEKRAPAVFYGVDQSTRGVFRAACSNGRPWLYVDNGYFRGRWAGGPYFRITANRAQHSGIGSSTGARFSALGLQVKPWRRAGTHVLIALQSDAWYHRHGSGPADYRRRLEVALAVVTDRPIVWRDKPLRPGGGRPLEPDLDDCWCVVTHTSNVGVDALLAGIPVIALGDCAAASMGGRDLAQLEAPPMPDGREAWARVLADNQWTLDEMAAGLPYAQLGESWASVTS